MKKCAGHLDRQVLPFAGPNANLPVLACFLFTVLRNCAFFLPDIWTGRSSAPAGPNANLPVRTGGPAHFAMYVHCLFIIKSGYLGLKVCVCVCGGRGGDGRICPGPLTALTGTGGSSGKFKVRGCDSRETKHFFQAWSYVCCLTIFSDFF